MNYRHHTARALTRAIPLLIGLLALAGCRRSGATGPATTHANSSQIATLAERAEFLHRYVTFRRTYETLDFDILFQNNEGGGVPGPSDWDVRIAATVPAAELQAWVPVGVQPSPTPDKEWLKTVPTSIDLSGVTEWYGDSRRIVGVDRERRIVVYRAWSW